MSACAPSTEAGKNPPGCSPVLRKVASWGCDDKESDLSGPHRITCVTGRLGLATLAWHAGRAQRSKGQAAMVLPLCVVLSESLSPWQPLYSWRTGPASPLSSLPRPGDVHIPPGSPGLSGRKREMAPGPLWKLYLDKVDLKKLCGPGQVAQLITASSYYAEVVGPIPSRGGYWS